MILTRRARDVLFAIDSHIRDHGYTPTYETICEMIGIASKGQVSGHVALLIENGYLRRAGRGMAVEVLRLPASMALSSLAGQIDATPADREALREMIADLTEIMDGAIALLDALDGDAEGEADPDEDDGSAEPDTVAA